MGDPLMEKVVVEGCVEVMKKDAVVGIEDMGGGGLRRSSGEMGSKG
ncbi:hypothetical protein, partial [Bacillus sp. WP8]